MLIFILSFIIFIILLTALYLKCKMPFWSKQPVFHMYNALYWLKPPGIIDKALPSLVDKYIDILHIKTFPLTEERNVLLTTVCNFIKQNYIKDNKQTHYSPTPNNILDYLQASNHASYYTIYQQVKMLFNKADLETAIDEIVAVITARPLYVRLYNGNKKHTRAFPTYYVDNLCVQPVYRKKNIAASMIRTHYYNLRQQNKHINTCLFKREGTLNAIVPLVVFNTYCFKVSAFTQTGIILPPSIALIEIGTSQLHLLVDFMKHHMATFECVILPDVTNLAHLIKTNNLKVFALLENSNIVAFYVFRVMELYYAGEKATECIATVTTCLPVLFQQGFSLALQKLNDHPQLVLIEDTAHSNLLFTHLLLTQPASIKFTSPTAFFFYNYACHSFKNNAVLIIY